MGSRRLAAYSIIASAIVIMIATSVTGQAADVIVKRTLSTRDVRTEESPLASVVADAIRAAGKAEIGLIAATSFTDATIPEGSAKPEDFVRSLMFKSDTVVVMRLTGAQVKTALEHGLGMLPARSAAFLQVSGIRIRANPTAQRGSRVDSIQVGKAALDPSRTYTVAMPSPLAGGALVYSKAWSRTDMDRDTGTTLEDALKAFLATTKEIGNATEERIVLGR